MKKIIAIILASLCIMMSTVSCDKYTFNKSSSNIEELLLDKDYVSKNTGFITSYIWDADTLIDVKAELPYQLEDFNNKTIIIVGRKTDYYTYPTNFTKIVGNKSGSVTEKINPIMAQLKNDEAIEVFNSFNVSDYIVIKGTFNNGYNDICEILECEVLDYRKW